MRKVYVLTPEGLVEADEYRKRQRKLRKAPAARIRDRSTEFDVIRIGRGLDISERTEGGYRYL